MEDLTDKQKREFLALIDLKVENELLWKFMKDNPLPFCLQRCENEPFEIKTAIASTLVNLVTMINNGKLVLKK